MLAHFANFEVKRGRKAQKNEKDWFTNVSQSQILPERTKLLKSLHPCIHQV
jgi:hypothetical protein